jgi:hypothetical protein
MATKRSKFGSPGDELASAVSELLDPLGVDELEIVTAASIREHRRRLAMAQKAYEAWKSAKAMSSPSEGALKAEYTQAMLDNFVQMTVVGALVDRLGYTPDVGVEENLS